MSCSCPAAIFECDGTTGLPVNQETMNIFADYRTGEPLSVVDNRLECEGRVVARLLDGVWSFFDGGNDFYEGAYLNRTRFVPRKDTRFHRLPFCAVNNGYVWEVCKHFSPGSKLLELGCASGVDYLAQRYSMVGLDFSLTSLQSLNGYEIRTQADAEHLPFGQATLDGAVSSYFWEHIEPDAKDRILKSLHRCLRPGGRVVFLYDVATRNGLIRAARSADSELYQSSFLDRDGHIGYETVQENGEHFEANGFRIVTHIGMERSWFLSASAYKKLAEFPGWVGRLGRIGALFSRGRLGYHANLAAVRLSDVSIGRLWPMENSRILMTVAERVG